MPLYHGQLKYAATNYWFKAAREGQRGNGVMDSLLACYTAGPGSIPAMLKWFILSSQVKVSRINKIESDMIKFACSSAYFVDKKNQQCHFWANVE